MSKVKDWLEGIPSPNTRKSYTHGIKKFEEYFGEGIETLIGSEDAGKIIEKFFVWLKDNSYTQNSARNLVNAPIQFLKFFNTPIKYRKRLGMYKTVPTTRDHMLTVDEARELFKVGSLEEKVMVKTWLLGLRISDASRLEWEQLDSHRKDEPIEVLIHTRKEHVVAHIFIDQEFQELLAKHIPNLDKSNKYLFQSEKGGQLSEKQLLRRLQALQKKAHIKAKGRFGWHIARKLFLRTCAELGVNRWNAKLMCGKSVSQDIMTYINGVSLKKDAVKVSNVLRMESQAIEESDRIGKLEHAISSLESENTDFKTRIDLLQKGLKEHQDKLKRATDEIVMLHANMQPFIDWHKQMKPILQALRKHQKKGE